MRVDIGCATLYLGNCAEILPGLPREAAIVSDPPYGQNRKHGNRATSPKQKDGNVWGRAWQPIKGDDHEFDPSPWLEFRATVLWGANHYCSRLPAHTNWLAWFKGVPESSDYSDCELAWTSEGTGSIKSKHILWSGFRRETEIREHYHPTQKPVALMEWCIRKMPVETTIIDPYMGSGTTGVASMKMMRPFIGIEIVREYFDVACERLDRASRQADLFAAIQ